MKNKLIFFLCLYLTSAVLALGLILPSFNSARQAVSNDNAAYTKDKALQAAHDNWMKSDEARQIKQHNDDQYAEYQYKIKVWEDNNPDKSSDFFWNTFSSGWNIAGVAAPQFIDIDALAWEKAGGYPPSNWQWGDQLKLSIDRGNLIHYENIFYVYALASIAYWIIIIGLLYFLKQKDVQAKG